MPFENQEQTYDRKQTSKQQSVGVSLNYNIFIFITRTHYPNNARKGMPPWSRSLIAGLKIVSQGLQSLTKSCENVHLHISSDLHYFYLQ